MNTIGTLFLNIDQAYFDIPSFSLTNTMYINDTIINQLINYYSNIISNQIFSVFGSLNIIGNPKQFISSIKAGINELINESFNGFSHFIYKGVLSLGRYSLWGMLNTFDKFIGGFSIIIIL